METVKNEAQELNVEELYNLNVNIDTLKNIEGFKDIPNNWVLWALKANGIDANGETKWTKPPINSEKLSPAKANDKKTWNSFELTVDKQETHKKTKIFLSDKVNINGKLIYNKVPAYIGGIGLMLPGTDFIFIDIDHCLDDDGRLSDLANDIVIALKTYTEISPSMHGLRCVLKDDGTFDDFRKALTKTHHKNKNTISGIEIYSSKDNRYCTLTGYSLDGFETFEINKNMAIKEVYSKYWVKVVKEKKEAYTKSEEPFNESEEQSPRLSNSEILLKLRNQKSGMKFIDIFDNGNCGDDASSTDIALMNMICFYTQDKTQAIELYSQSKHHANRGKDTDKGDYGTKRGMDYIDRTFDNAISRLTAKYDPFYNKNNDTTKKSNNFDVDTNDYIIKFFESRNIIYKIEGDKINFCCNVCGDADYQNTLCIKTLLIATQSSTCKDDTHGKAFRQIERELKTLRTRYEKEVAEKKRSELLSRNLKDDTYKDFVLDKNFNIYKYASIDGYYQPVNNTKEWENIIYNANGGVLKRTEYRDIEGQVRNALNKKDDSQSNLLNVKNGLVDIMTGEVLPHDREIFFKYRIPFDYNPAANSGLLYDTVCEILGEESIIELKKMLGYIMHKSTKFEKHFMFKGTKGGSNGKGTLLGLISGDSIYHGLLRHLGVDSRIDRLNDKFGLDIIQDKHFLIDKDIKEGYWEETDIMRKMASGEPIDFRRCHTADMYQIQTHCKIIVATNSDPKVKGGDGGFWRRWVIFNCDKTFKGDKLDINLKDKLNSSDVYSTLLNWCIEGYRMVETFNKRGLFFKENEKALNEWKRGNDNILVFVEEHCKLGSEYRIRAKHLYDVFRLYLKESGLRDVSAKTFYKYLEDNYKIGRIEPKGYATLLGIDFDKDRPVDCGGSDTYNNACNRGF
jgi:P4 family phage/plasmid primase-like protien